VSWGVVFGWLMAYRGITVRAWLLYYWFLQGVELCCGWTILSAVWMKTKGNAASVLRDNLSTRLARKLAALAYMATPVELTRNPSFSTEVPFGRSVKRTRGTNATNTRNGHVNPLLQGMARVVPNPLAIRENLEASPPPEDGELNAPSPVEMRGEEGRGEERGEERGEVSPHMHIEMTHSPRAGRCVPMYSRSESLSRSPPSAIVLVNAAAMATGAGWNGTGNAQDDAVIQAILRENVTDLRTAVAAEHNMLYVDAQLSGNGRGRNGGNTAPATMTQRLSFVDNPALGRLQEEEAGVRATSYNESVSVNVIGSYEKESGVLSSDLIHFLLEDQGEAALP
jgi:hypothetical protein